MRDDLSENGSISTPVGNTGVHLPQVIYGTSSFGNLYRELDATTRRDIVGEMFRTLPGVIAFDSAGKYGAGLALESLGDALRHHRIPGERVLISNKLGWRRIPLTTDEPTFEPGVWVGLNNDAVQDISGDGILRCWEEGQQLLGEYSAELLSVHDPDEYLAAANSDADRVKRWADVLEAYRSLETLKAEGKASAIGVGVKDWRLAERLTRECDLDWVMIAACFTVYRHEKELMEFLESLRQRGIAVINSAVFHGGFLTGGEFFDYRRVSPATDPELFDWRERFVAVCRAFNTTPAQAAVAFSVSPPGIVSVALNNSRVKYVESNANMARTELGNDFWQALKQEQLIASDFPYLG